MEIDQVETFLAVATFGGFHRAAEALRISQPAISARIKALEESLGVSLFARSRSGLTLSEAGRTLRPYAEQLLRTASLARQAVHELQPGSAGPLEIAAALSISVYYLPDVLKHFRRAHPHVIINIRSGHSKEVLDMVLGEEAEIGLARSLQHPEVETFSLRDDPLLLIAHSSQSPQHSRRARLQQVASWPLIFYERGSSDWTLDPQPFSPRRPGSQYCARSGQHRDRKAHGGAWTWFRVPSADGGDGRDATRQAAAGQNSRCRTAGTQSGRDSSSASSAAGGGAGILEIS